MKCRALNVYHNLSKMLILPDIKNGSSVKCVDTFRIAFTEESKVFVEQKEGYDCLSRLLYLSSDTENLFF